MGWRNAAFAILVGAVVFMSQVVLPKRDFGFPQAEIYPFFDWKVFHHGKGRDSDFGIEVTRVDGRPQDPPLELSRLVTDPRRLWPIDAYYEAHKLGLSTKEGDPRALRRAQGLFERRVLRRIKGWERASLEYRLVWRTYLPIAYWKRKELLAAEPVAVFRAEAEP